MEHQEKIKLITDSLIFATSREVYEKFLEKMDNSSKIQIYSIHSEVDGIKNGNTFIRHRFDFKPSTDKTHFVKGIRIVVAFNNFNSSFKIIKVEESKDEED